MEKDKNKNEQVPHNLFEDNGNFHDEEQLKKSYQRMPEKDKK